MQTDIFCHFKFFHNRINGVNVAPLCHTRALCRFMQKEDSGLNEVDATGMHNFFFVQIEVG